MAYDDTCRSCRYEHQFGPDEWCLRTKPDRLCTAARTTCELIGTDAAQAQPPATNKPSAPVLSAPSAHSLQECLAELKFGRPAAGQRFLDGCIRRLNRAHVG